MLIAVNPCKLRMRIVVSQPKGGNSLRSVLWIAGLAYFALPGGRVLQEMRGQETPGQETRGRERDASDAKLAAITQRGRALAEYDAAVWHAADVAQAANPKTVEGQHSLARKENGKWTVVFGVLSADKSKFLITYEAEQFVNGRNSP